MKISSQYFKKVMTGITFFFIFSGYYVILIILTNVGLTDASRYFTIPIRIFILGCIALIYLLKPRFKLDKSLLFFLIFSLFYISRIGLEFADKSTSYHISEIEFYLYFLSFVFFPFLFLSNISFDRKEYKTIFITILISSAILSILTYLFYGDMLGEAYRISMGQKQDNYISPLSLSYCSILSVGIGGAYLMINRPLGKEKVIIIGTVLLNLIPFLLGASRGAVLALIVPFMIYFIFRKGFKRKVKIIVVLIFGLFVLISIADSLGSGAFARLLSLESDFQRGGGAAIRLDMWRRGIITFIENPIFGNTLESTFYNNYPHNLFIEVLISTGILGFIPFILYIFYIFITIINLIRESPRFFWITVIFLQAFMQGMFSGGLYSASWLAVGSGLIVSINKYKN